MIFVRLTVFGI